MNRVLKRPMFRLGGSAEGITSGLDGPNINASRTGFKDSFFDVGTQSQLTKQWHNNQGLQEDYPKVEDYLEAVAETIQTHGSLSSGDQAGMGSSELEDQVEKYNKVIGEVNQATGLNTPKYKVDYDKYAEGEHQLDPFKSTGPWATGQWGPDRGTTYSPRTKIENEEDRYGAKHDDQVGSGGIGIKSINTRNEGGDTAPPSKSALEQLYEEQIAMEKKNAYEDEGIKPGAPGSVSSMLMNFGLNLAGQPGGDLVGAIGRAGSPALQRFQQAKLAERLDKRKTEREMRRDALDRAVDIRTAQIEAAGEIGAAGDTRFAFEATQQRMEELQGRGDELDVTISELKSKTIRNPDEEKRLQEAIRDKKNNEELQVLITKNPPKDIIGLTILKQIENGLKDMADYYEYLDDPDAYRKKEIAAREESADGGRAGYDIGGEVIEDVSSVSENVNMGPTAPAETQQLTYDELRSRLPREISNDIISLLAMSKQALTDFANIQTQQDVDNFNRSYNVDLVLPQEG